MRGDLMAQYATIIYTVNAYAYNGVLANENKNENIERAGLLSVAGVAKQTDVVL